MSTEEIKSTIIQTVNTVTDMAMRDIFIIAMKEAQIVATKKQMEAAASAFVAEIKRRS